MSNLATIVNNILADSGIDDINVVVTNGSYSNPAWITALGWSKITGTPTTLSGYGITDAVPSSRTITINGVTQDLSANRSWTITAGVSSVNAGTGISVNQTTGAVTITNTGVLSINGSTGAVTGIITTSNYNSYSPTLTGGGASGTWGISITGDAGSVGGIDPNRIVYGSGPNKTNNINSFNTALASGFYDGYQATGAPTAGTYYHLIASRHTNTANDYQMQIAGDFFNAGLIYYRIVSNGTPSAWGQIWTSQNDGAGSGLDADLLDGQHGSYYAAASSLSNYLPLAGGTMSGQILGPSTGSDVYGGLVQVRERGYVLATQSDWSYSPAITFHWGNRAAIRFGLRADGLMAVDDAPIALRSWVTSQGYLTSGFVSSGTVFARTAVTTYRDHNASAPNDAPIKSLSGSEDNWIYLDSANAQWGIYHRNIDSALSVAGQPTLPANSIAFVGGNDLNAYICLADGTIFGKAMSVNGNTVLHAGNYNSYAPTLTGGGASGTWSINVTGSSGSAGVASYVNGTSGGAIQTWDIRTIAPSNMSSYRLGFGFTSWSNNNSAPWADYIHLRSYGDASGGNDNLIMFLKNGIGMRIWQQSFGSGTAYASYVDVLHSSNYSSYALPLSGGTVTGLAIFSGKATLGSNSSGTYNGNTVGLTLNSVAEVRSTGTQNPPALTWHYEGLATRHILMNSAGTLNVVSPSSENGGVAILAVNGNTVLHAGNYNSYSPTLTGGGASGTWGINVTGKSGTSFVTSDRDFPSGTLVQTSIPYGDYGDPFVLEITGNSYFNYLPIDVQIQGYIYAGTIIAAGGLSNGKTISGIRAIRYNGNLCFWWPTGGYWEGFTVRVYSAYGGAPYNKVTSISNTTQPTTDKQFDFSLVISVRSDNVGSYALPIGGGTITSRTYLHQSGAGGGQNLFTGVEGPTSANGRAQFILCSAYSDLVVASSQSNNNHGSTISFTAYNPDNAGDYRKFVINQGNWGSRMSFMDFGYANAAYTNPHSYINSTDTAFTIDGNNKRIGIGNINPSFAVDATGTMRASSDVRAPIFYDSNDTTYYLDPNSSLLSLKVAGNIDLIARSASWAEGIRIRVPNTSTWGGIRFTRDRAGDAGNWAIGFTGIDASDDLTFWSNNSDGGAMRLRMTLSGAATFSSTVTASAFYESSDSRIKELIENNYRTKEIESIKPRLYKKNGRLEVGYYAQDFESIAPTTISIGSDNYLSLSYTQVHTMKIAYLEDSIEEIKTKILHLENQLKQIR